MTVKTPMYIDIDAHQMRARSWIYPDDPYVTDNPLLSNHHTNTTHFNIENKSFDVGFQRLRIFNIDSYIKKYPMFGTLQKLYIDHNNLTELPDPKVVPNLTYLNCSHNKIKYIPLYPKLTFINFANNKILDLSDYHNSQLEYIDCGYNMGFSLNFQLPRCKHLYANNIGLTSINFELYPCIEYVDCGYPELVAVIQS